MSAPLARRCLTAGGITLALALTAPLPALAASGEGPGRESAQASGGGRPAAPPSPRSEPSTAGASAEQPAGAPSSSESSSSGSSHNTGEQGRTEQGRAGQSRPEKRRPEERRPEERRSEQRRPASEQPARSAGGDPRGNNGSITVDGAPFDDSRGNEPHVGCDVRVVFWGFDEGDRATLTLTGQAPTGGGLLHQETATISDDPAGGGQDRDAALVFSARAGGALDELLAVAPHPQQGWHVKVAVDVLDAPGGAKQKVFWMDCPVEAPGDTTTAPAGGAEQLPGTSSAGTVVSGTTAEAATVDGVVAPATEQVTAVAGTALTLGAAGLTTGAATVEAGAVGGRLAGQAGVGPQALPFTGPQAIGALVSLGVGSLLAGGLAHRLGRRRPALA